MPRGNRCGDGRATCAGLLQKYVASKHELVLRPVVAVLHAWRRDWLAWSSGPAYSLGWSPRVRSGGFVSAWLLRDLFGVVCGTAILHRAVARMLVRGRWFSRAGGGVRVAVGGVGCAFAALIA